MKCTIRILCLLSIITIIASPLNAFETTSPQSSQTTSYSLLLTVQTDQPFYGFGENVKILGNLTDMNGTAVRDALIALEVRNPRNTTIFVDIVFSSTDGTYEDGFRLSNNTALGEYHVYVTANAAGYATAANQTTFTVVTKADLSEKSFIESALAETLREQKALLNNAAVSGDLTGTVNFTYFEIVDIATGSFAGKGFSRGDWKAVLDGILYSGSHEGVLFLKPSERRIYLKGAISGEISGIVEGFISETVNGSGIYNRYQATWKIGRIRTTTVSATLNLNGTLTYNSYSEYPATALYVLQTSIEGSAFGHYNCSISSTITHVRFMNSSHTGEGFSIISYSSNYGMGEGWAYCRLASPGIVEMEGFLTSPLYGIVHATLNETSLPRNLQMYIERVDLGLPPMADLKLKIWGPERVSPGQKITYAIELRNDGLKSAENVTLANEFPWAVDYLSNTGGGVYKDYFREVDWHLDVPAKGNVYLTTQGRVMWGLPGGTILGGFAKILQPTEIETDPSIETTCETIECNSTFSKVKVTIANQLDSVAATWEISTTKIAEKRETTVEVDQISEDTIEIKYKFIVFDAELGSGEEIVARSIENIGALDKLLGFTHRLPEYVEKTARFELQQDWANNLYLQGKISEELWKDLQFINDGEYIGLTIVKEIATFVPLSGKFVSEFGYLTWDPPIRRFVQHYRMTAIASGDINLYLDFVDAMQQSQVVIARDPNIKYGPDGYVSSGQTLNYTIEYENEGEGIAYGVHVTDTLDEDLNNMTLEIGSVISTSNGSVIAGPGTYNPSTRTITWLVGEVGPGEGGVANFSAKVRDDAPEGIEIINSATVYFPSVPETTRTNTIVSVVGQPNIAVRDLTPLETSAKIGSILHLNATLANEGYFAETANITLYANSTTIGTRNITLTGRSENTVIFIWNTTNSLTGNYAISAYVWPVLGETNTVDNTFVDGWVVVTSHGWELDFAASTRHPIVDFAVYNGSLYAAADNKLYVKDGSSWNVVDAPTFVTSLEPYGGKLVVGGQGGLYCFDGTSFNMVFSVPTYIKVLGVYNNTLYAGTFLDKPQALYYCNGSPDDPSNWHVDNGFSTILNFSGPFGSIDSFAVYDNAMFVSSGGTVYSYNGTEWSIVKTYDDVYAFCDMAVYDDKLCLATRDQAWRKPYYQGYSGFNGRVIEFDGNNWTTILDHDYWIYSLEIYDNKLYAGTANKMMVYNGTNWNTSFNALDGAYYAISLTVFDGKIYAGMGNGYIFADPVSEITSPPELPPSMTVPEFPSTMFLPLFVALSLTAVVFVRRRYRRKLKT